MNIINRVQKKRGFWGEVMVTARTTTVRTTRNILRARHFRPIELNSQPEKENSSEL
jgi:hypothetical protein